MKLSTLLNKVARCSFGGSPDPEVTGLYYDSRQVQPGGFFFALRGEVTDGHRFIGDALDRGAVAVLVEDPLPLRPGVAQIVAEDPRQAMAEIARTFYGDPASDLPVIGVTGTNGKTTVTYLLESILSAAGRAPAVLGTINYRFGRQIRMAPHTTPEAIDLFGALAEFRKEGARSLVMEVSSHALAQRRVAGLRFDVGIFTNLTPEHLDYHGDMETYFESKRILFHELLAPGSGRAAVNGDDPYGARLAAELSEPLTCGRDRRNRVHPAEVELTLEGISGVLETPVGPVPFRSSLLGEFNLQNILCAAAAATAMGLPPEIISEGLSGAPQVPGRMERIENRRGVQILVDYAHTGDALEKVLLTVRDLKPRRILTVFGCGGDRDRAKRPVMGEVAARHSHLAVLTSDNPRSEDPARIIEEVRAGILKAAPPELTPEETKRPQAQGYVVVSDREQAIELAVAALQPGDLLVVAGKGHEDYQVIGSKRLHFDDREKVRQALEKAEAGA